ncbi:MAG TPA: methyltransferase domain-containing protein [Actinospica sp.]|nr:methyltransferase domain-containing protein [Actinospica sp.]
MHKRIGVLVLAHNAADVLPGTLDRIPGPFRDRIEEIIVLDDASADDTFPVAAAWGRRNRLGRTTVLRHTKRLGHGGTRKAGLRLALDHGLDVLALLEADGRHSPEALPALVGPILHEAADLVIGRPEASRDARWKLAPLRLGERIMGASLSGVHAGFRAYGTAALREIAFEADADGPGFDAQVVIQLRHAAKRIVEIPVPDQPVPADLRRGVGVLRDVLEYRRVGIGFGTSDWVPQAEPEPREDDLDSHRALLAELADLPMGRVLDLGCGDGRFAAQIRGLGHRVVGVDRAEAEGVRDRMNLFVRADLNEGIPPEARVAAGYDVVIAADVLQFLVQPEDLLRQIHSVLRPGGQVYVCVPNAVHWYPRLRFLLGRFDYDRRGILDVHHLRFFTRRSLRRLLVRTGYDILEAHGDALPFGGQRLLVRVLPDLFAYRLTARTSPHHEDTIGVPSLADEVFGAHYAAVPRQQERRRQEA